MGPNFFQTRAGIQFQNRLLNALEKIGEELERANNLKEKELESKEGENN